MQCTKLNLQERAKIRPKSVTRHDKPRRYCQKLLVDSRFQDDSQWMDVLQRFHCTDYSGCYENRTTNVKTQQDADDLYLSVQNLQFKGEIQQNKRPRTSFKYKTITDGQTHRMFVKQIVDENVAYVDGDYASELTCYYFDDYVNYIANNDQSSPCSAKSSIFIYNVGNKLRENKSVQVDFKSATKTNKKDQSELIPDETCNNKIEIDEKHLIKEEQSKDYSLNTDHSKIAFHKSGKRKSITISKSESPETIQVIRVDVVCNYNCSSSTMSDYDEHKKLNNNGQIRSVETRKQNTNTKTTHYASKYLLMNTVKALDENVSGGANVTLLCKTFRLADRLKMAQNNKS